MVRCSTHVSTLEDGSSDLDMGPLFPDPINPIHVWFQLSQSVTNSAVMSVVYSAADILACSRPTVTHVTRADVKLHVRTAK